MTARLGPDPNRNLSFEECKFLLLFFLQMRAVLAVCCEAVAGIDMLPLVPHENFLS